MKNLNELEKDILCDKFDKLVKDLTDDEFEYICYLANSWLKERKLKEFDK